MELGSSIPNDPYKKFIPIYPDDDDPEFQAKIAAKYEFQELRGTPNEVLEPGGFYNHQILIKRFMREYPKLLLYHAAGTGKTCTITLVAEDFKVRKLLDGSVRKCLIISPSEDLGHEFKNQIVMKCTGDIYKTKVIKTTKDTTQKRKIITKKLQKNWYEFFTYITFRTEIMKKYASGKDYLDDDDWKNISKDYRNYMIACDEIHILQNEKSIGGKGGRLSDAYEFFKTFFRRVKNVRYILSTATPMINGFEDFRRIINLLNDEDIGELNINDKHRTEKLISYLNGKVSYVRALDTGINAVQLGFPLKIVYKNGSPSQLILYSGIMSPFQSLGYLKAYLEDISSGVNRVWLKSRQASGFVFPDGSFGTKGFEKYFGKARDIKNDNFQSSLLMREFKNGTNKKQSREQYYSTILANIGKYSIKMYNTLNTLVLPGQKVTEGKYPGARFEFFELIQSGLAPFCVALQALGFEQFNIGGDLNNVIKDGKIIIEKRPRYGVITGNSENAISSNLIEVLNHPSNLNGEYIQLIVGSKATKIGYNFYNIQLIDIFEPWWNPSSIYQATFRGIRTTGHEAILAFLRKDDPNARLNVYITKNVAIPIDKELLDQLIRYKNIRKGIPKNIKALLESYNDEDLEDLEKYKKKLDTKWDEIVAITQNEKERLSEDSEEASAEELPEEGEEINAKDLAGISIVEDHIPPSRDIIMYEISEQKEMEIKVGDRDIKTIAFDCELNLARNIRSTDKDGTPECDYTKCKYKPIYPSKGTDYSTYNLLYSGDVVNEYKESLFTGKHLNVDPMIRDIAMTSLQQDLLENTYKFPRFYKNVSDYLYPSAPGIKFDTFADYYLDNLIVTETTPMETLAAKITHEKEQIISIRNLDIVKDNLREELEQLSIDALIDLIEEILMSDEKSDADLKILSIYRNYIFTLISPQGLAEQREKMRIKEMAGKIPGKKSKGSKPSVDTDWGDYYVSIAEKLFRKYGVKSESELPSEVGLVRIHTLNILKLKFTGKNYAIVKKYTKFSAIIRVLDLSDPRATWENAGEDEQAIFEKIVGSYYKQKLIPENKDANEKLIPYGISIPMMKKDVLQDTFRLHVEKGGNDKTYKICSTYEISNLFNVLYQLNFSPNVNIGDKTARNLAREQLHFSLPSDVEEDSRIGKKMLQSAGRIIQYLINRDKRVDKNSLCELIQKKLKENGDYFALRVW